MLNIDFDNDKFETYKKILESKYVELYEMALMLSNHKFDSKLFVPKKHRERIFREYINAFILNKNNEAKDKSKLFYKILSLLKTYAENDNSSEYVNNNSLKNTLFSLEPDAEEKEEENPYSFWNQKYFIFLKNPFNIIRKLCEINFIFPIEIQEYIGLRQFERTKDFLLIEERHLRVQATALALFVLSGQILNIEDICDNPIMKKINEDFFYTEKKLADGAKQNTVKELISEVILTKIGRPNKSLIKLREKWKKFYKYQKELTSINEAKLRFNLSKFYNITCPIPKVFQIKNNKKYIDFPRFIATMNTWDKMQQLGFISRAVFYSFLSLIFFAKAKYEIGLIFPNSMPFGEFYHKRLNDFMMDINL